MVQPVEALHLPVFKSSIRDRDIHDARDPDVFLSLTLGYLTILQGVTVQLGQVYWPHVAFPLNNPRIHGKGAAIRCLFVYCKH